MAWNRGESEKTRVSGYTGSKRCGLKGALAGAVVVALSVAAFLALHKGGESEVPSKGAGLPKGQIAEVKPAPAPIAPMTEREKPEREIPYWERDTTNGLSEAQIRKWQNMRASAPSVTNNFMAARQKSRFEVFNYSSENEIAAILTLEPGEGIVGSPNYGDAFRENFIKSCEAPIIVGDKDDDYTAQLKRDMIQVKIELRERMANGQDICDIMAEAREEAMRLGAIKQQVGEQLRELLSSAKTAEEVDVSIEAANEMLKAKGIAPLQHNPIVVQRLKSKLRNQ